MSDVKKTTAGKPDPHIGKVIDNCVLDRKLGQGGMGIAYLATHKDLKRPFVIKLLNPSLTGSADTVQRFYREAQSVARLNHPNIVAIQNVGQDNDFYFIRMEYVEGVTLESVVRARKKVPWRDATTMIIKTARALAHAHQKGIVHRDIKPENIMFSENEETIKVMDFGLAKQVQSATKVSVTGQIVGTPFFMSPEQAGGKETDARSDIYSLGVTYYYMLSGVKPFSGKNLQEIFLKHFFYTPESPKIYTPDLPQDICDIIRVCLKKKKNERYQNADKLADDLQAALDSAETEVEEVEGDKTQYLQLRPAKPTDQESQDIAKAMAAAQEGDATAVTPGAQGLGIPKPQDSQDENEFEQTAVRTTSPLMPGVDLQPGAAPPPGMLPPSAAPRAPEPEPEDSEFDKTVVRQTQPKTASLGDRVEDPDNDDFDQTVVRQASPKVSDFAPDNSEDPSEFEQTAVRNVPSQLSGLMDGGMSGQASGQASGQTTGQASGQSPDRASGRYMVDEDEFDDLEQTAIRQNPLPQSAQIFDDDDDEEFEKTAVRTNPMAGVDISSVIDGEAATGVYKGEQGGVPQQLIDSYMSNSYEDDDELDGQTKIAGPPSNAMTAGAAYALGEEEDDGATIVRTPGAVPGLPSYPDHLEDEEDVDTMVGRVEKGMELPRHLDSGPAAPVEGDATVVKSVGAAAQPVTDATIVAAMLPGAVAAAQAHDLEHDTMVSEVEPDTMVGTVESDTVVSQMPRSAGMLPGAISEDAPTSTNLEHDTVVKNAIPSLLPGALGPGQKTVDPDDTSAMAAFDASDYEEYYQEEYGDYSQSTPPGEQDYDDYDEYQATQVGELPYQLPSGIVDDEEEGIGSAVTPDTLVQSPQAKRQNPMANVAEGDDTMVHGAAASEFAHAATERMETGAPDPYGQSSPEDDPNDTAEEQAIDPRSGSSLKKPLRPSASARPPRSSWARTARRHRPVRPTLLSKTQPLTTSCRRQLH